MKRYYLDIIIAVLIITYFLGLGGIESFTLLNYVNIALYSIAAILLLTNIILAVRTKIKNRITNNE